MINFINKKTKSFLRKTKNCFSHPEITRQPRSSSKSILDNKKGQISVVIIILIAIGLIFYAISLNIGKLAQGKVIATIASNLAAAKLASYMASYGEQIYQEQMGGETKICGYTGAFKALMLIVVLIAVIVFAPMLAGANGMIFGVTTSTIQGAAAISAAFSAVSLVLQATVIEPAITAAWNNIIWENLSITDSFMEQGVGTALKNAVTDQVQIPDLIDIDMDGVFGLTVLNDPNTALDRVSRFGYHYLMRIKGAPPPPDLGSFFPCLCAMLYVDDTLCPGFRDTDGDCQPDVFPPEAAGCLSQDWGIFDPLPCGIWNDVWGVGGQSCCPTAANRLTDINFPAMCDPCCQPQYVPSNLREADEPDAKEWILCRDGRGVADPEECYNLPVAQGGDGIPHSGDDSEPVLMAPECCYLPAGDPGKCGNPDTCTARSPYYNSFLGLSNDALGNYPWVFDPHYENANNNNAAAPGCPAGTHYISFREAMGRDDEHKDFNVVASNPNWHDVTGICPGGGGQCPRSLPPDPPAGPGRSFYIKDATGYYNTLVLDGDDNPVHVPPVVNVAEEKRGIFPLFYKLQDWGIDLTQLDFTLKPIQADRWLDYHCYWCDITLPDPAAVNPRRSQCNTLPNFIVDPNINELRSKRLDVPLDPNSAPANLSGALVGSAGWGWCLDNQNVFGQIPIKADNIRNLAGLFFAPDGTCPQETGGWRRGFDAYCDQVYPYDQGCSKNLGYKNCTNIMPIEAGDPIGPTSVPMGCICSSAPAPESCHVYTGVCTGAATINDFPDDNLDQIIIEFHDFIDWAKSYVNTPEGVMRARLMDWYEEAADWIEPGCSPQCSYVSNDGGCPDASCCVPANDTACPGSYTNKQRSGKLWVWRDILRPYHAMIDQWLELTSFEDPLPAAGGLNDYAWCIPNPADPWYNCSPLAEQATFNLAAGGNPAVTGDIYDILACLKWNSSDAVDHPVIPWGEADPVNLMVSRPAHLGPGDPIEVEGNALKFRACYEACNKPLADRRDFFVCYDLPRSLDPAFCPLKPFQPPWDASKWDTCVYALWPAGPGPFSNRPDATPPPAAPPTDAQLYNTCGLDCGPINFYDYPPYFEPAGLMWDPPEFIESAPIICSSVGRSSCASLGGVPPLNTAAAPNNWCFEAHTCVGVNCTCRQVISPPTKLAGGDGSCIDPLFYETVIQMLTIDFGPADLEGSCAPAGAFMTALQNSETQAYNQVAKFDYRNWFMSNRVREAEYVRDTLGRTIDELTRFLDGGTPYNLGPDNRLGTDDENPDGLLGTADDLFDSPAETLVYQRAHMDYNTDSRLASVAVYVWRDPPLPARDGYSHAVKVEARIPKRCNSGCGTDIWPYVKTEEHTFERCYKLVETTGRVKVRVIRFDEEKVSAMRFPDNMLIWQTQLHHPFTGSPDPGLLTQTFINCQPVMDPLLMLYPWGNPASALDYFGYSFMLNSIPTDPTAGTPATLWYDLCWREVHRNMLEYGVVSETCAQYYFGGGDNFGPRGFKMQFVPCDRVFLQGWN